MSFGKGQFNTEYEINRFYHQNLKQQNIKANKIGCTVLLK
jgi:hypothetical protein